MGRFRFRVDETFTIRGRGTVLLSGVRPEGDKRFHIGGPLVLRRPDGTATTIPIGGIEFPNPSDDGDLAVLIGLPKESVPIGTDVWSAG